MSTAAAPVRPGPRPPQAEPPHRPSLRLVATRPLAAGRLPFALLVGSILAVGLIGLLMLHTLAAQDAFRLQHLQHTSSSLNDAEQQLALAEQQAEAPGTIARSARALGMVPTGSIAFVRVGRHGKIVGVAHAAVAPAPPPAPTPTPTPSTSAAPKPTGQASTKPTTKPTGRATKPAHRHRRAASPGRG